MATYLASATESETVDLTEVMERLSSSTDFESMPRDFNHVEFVTSLTKTEKVPESEGLQESVNEIFSSLSQPDALPKTTLFLEVQWSKIFASIKKDVSENTNKKVQRKEFTGHFSDLHSLLTSHDLEKEFAELMGVPVSLLAEQHYHALTEIVLQLNTRIVSILVGERFPSARVEANRMNVSTMTDEGKGKVRYCGAWAIAKVRHACQDYFKANIHSSDPNVRSKAKSAYAKSALLSQLTWSSTTAQQHSRYKDTLNVTLSRKYDKGTLVHITDDVFEWILDLEQERINYLTSESLARHQEELVENALMCINKNNQLLDKWKSLFPVSECLQVPSDDVAPLMLQLFKEIVIRYVKMGVGEFLRDFRRDFKLQKTEAHRKKVVEKKKKKDLGSSKVTLESIKGDTSTNKQHSHSRLKAMVIQQGSIFQSTVYSKGEIQLLCKAYGVAFRRSDSKTQLSDKLVPKISESLQLLHPDVLDNSTQQAGPSGAIVTTEDVIPVSLASGPQPGRCIE